MTRPGPRASAAREALRSQLWPLPVLGVLVAVLLGVALPEVDARLVDRLPGVLSHHLFRGGPGAGREVLAVIAGSLVTVTSLTFSLTVVTLQLASSQHSPRVLRTFSQDRAVHAALAVLLGTFTYTLTIMRTVRTDLDDQEPFVPQLSVTFAYLLALASVVTLVLFLAHLARKIRVESILRDVHTETSQNMDRLLSAPSSDPAQMPTPPGPYPVTLCAPSSGFLTVVDAQALLAAAVDADAIIHLHRQPGESLVTGTPVALAWSTAARPIDPGTRDRLQECLDGAIETGFERTATQDIGYGLRQITDIAVRALSPGINDPTTALHALSHSAALLCQAVGRQLGPQSVCDDTGRVRVVLDRPDLAALLHLAIAQPCRYGAREPVILGRLLLLLREVAWSTTSPPHHDPIREHLAQIRETAGSQELPPLDRHHLDGLAATVEDALCHRWPVPPPSGEPLH